MLLRRNLLSNKKRLTYVSLFFINPLALGDELNYSGANPIVFYPIRISYYPKHNIQIKINIALHRNKKEAHFHVPLKKIIRWRPHGDSNPGRKNENLMS